MDYSKLSDAEINQAVAAIQFPQSEINTPYYHRPDTYIYHRNGTYEVKDYCNNAADAWPIILENKISINYLQAEGEWLAHADGLMKEGCWCWDVEPSPFFLDIKPLRAATIVFLMMQEGE